MINQESVQNMIVDVRMRRVRIVQSLFSKEFDSFCQNFLKILFNEVVMITMEKMLLSNLEIRRTKS